MPSLARGRVGFAAAHPVKVSLDLASAIEGGVKAHNPLPARADYRVGALIYGPEDDGLGEAPRGYFAPVWTLGLVLGYLLGRRNLSGLFKLTRASAAANAAGAFPFLGHAAITMRVRSHASISSSRQ